MTDCRKVSNYDICTAKNHVAMPPLATSRRISVSVVKCQLLQFAPQQTTASIDHLVGAAQQREWHIYAERLCGLQVDDQLEF